MKIEFDSLQFSKDLQIKQITQGNLSLRAAADQIGISASTLSRLQFGKNPDLMSYAKSCHWLEKKLDVIDFANRDLSNFVKFATSFAFNAGHLPSGTYKSPDGKFTIEYLPTIISSNTGREMETPARISKTSGRIQVSQKKFVPSSVPMRMAILLHEYSHFYINDDINNETEADLNGLLIYLGLGYPRFEAHEAFLKTFIDTPSHQNKVRYDKIKKFIDDFENNNLIVYE